MLADFGDIKWAVRQEVDKELDHKFLNELEIFNGQQPTSERIAVYIAQRVQTLLDKSLAPCLTVSRVMAWESEDACATYCPD